MFFDLTFLSGVSTMVLHLHHNYHTETLHHSVISNQEVCLVSLADSAMGGEQEKKTLYTEIVAEY